jgi:hypothetical protein
MRGEILLFSCLDVLKQHVMNEFMTIKQTYLNKKSNSSLMSTIRMLKNLKVLMKVKLAED